MEVDQYSTPTEPYCELYPSQTLNLGILASGNINTQKQGILGQESNDVFNNTKLSEVLYDTTSTVGMNPILTYFPNITSTSNKNKTLGSGTKRKWDNVVVIQNSHNEEARLTPVISVQYNEAK